MSELNRMLELLKQLAATKQNLSDTLVSKGEEAEFAEPFDDLIQKAADYIPKSYILVDEDGDEVAGALVSQETVFDATVDDVREGKVFATELGVKTGEKIIPAYYTKQVTKVITNGSSISVSLPSYDSYDYTQFQAIICDFNTNMSDSVSASKVVINDNVYAVSSTTSISSIAKDSTNKSIEFGITNETEKPLVIRCFTYKEI